MDAFCCLYLSQGFGMTRSWVPSEMLVLKWARMVGRETKDVRFTDVNGAALAL